jgi:metal-sulfur cluster biosynthetic enzyme
MAEAEQAALKSAIMAALRQVIDPETNVDVVRMRLVEDLEVRADGKVEYTFRPSSPFCPLAVFLIAQIKKAVSEVPGIAGQRIQVVGYTAAEELTELINQEV